MIVGCFTGKCCFLYNRGELDVVVVERSTHTNGMHELCDDPAVCSRTTMNAPYGLLCATWLLPRRAGVGTMRGLVVGRGTACSCHLLGKEDKSSFGRVCVGTMLTCPLANASYLGGLTPNPVFFRDAVLRESPLRPCLPGPKTYQQRTNTVRPRARYPLDHLVCDTREAHLE